MDINFLVCTALITHNESLKCLFSNAQSYIVIDFLKDSLYSMLEVSKPLEENKDKTDDEIFVENTESFFTTLGVSTLSKVVESILVK